MRIHVKNIYKTFAASTVALTAYRTTITANVKVLQDLLSDLESGPDTDMLRASLFELIGMNQKHEENLGLFSEMQENVLVAPLQKFVKRDVRDARYYSHEVLKAQVEYDASLKNIMSVKSKSKSDSKKYTSALADFQAVQTRFDGITSEAMGKHQRLQDANCFDNTLRFTDYVRGMRDFYNEGARAHADIFPKLVQFENDIRRRQKDRDSRSNEIARSIVHEETRRTQIQQDDLLDVRANCNLKCVSDKAW